MIIQVIKLKSNLPEVKLLKKAKERESNFKSVPGLLQKYYVKTREQGEYGGVYIWESEESMESYQTSELANSVAQAYEIIEAPNTELMNIIFQLRND